MYYMYFIYIQISFEGTNIKSCLRNYINIYKSPLRAPKNLIDRTTLLKE